MREAGDLGDESAKIRTARPDEAPLLSDLALRSKAYWGYDDVFLDACRAELEVHPADIARYEVSVIETANGLGGFYLLRAIDPGANADESEAELELFYIDPPAIGAGHGRLLWRHMVVSARRNGYKRITIHSDPHAEGFYRAMGARRIGEVASGSIEGRRLPLMLIDLEEGDELP